MLQSDGRNGVVPKKQKDFSAISHDSFIQFKTDRKY